MPLSRREIRTRATRFVKEWANAHNEDADAKPFWQEFFDVFGIRSRTVGSYEVHVKKLNKADGYIDYFWPGTLLVEHKSKGKDLEKAFIQANDYFHGLKEHEKPRYLLVSDFHRFRLKDLETGALTELTLDELPQRIEVFDFISGYTVRTVRAEDPVNIKAAELMGRLHDELKATGYEGRELEVYLVRLLFILFADDTGIFERDAFYNFIETQTREDGTDVGAQLAMLFQLLNTPDAKRPKNLDERLADFKYINGKLFEGHLPLASWDGAMRVTLMECASLNWSAISPAIFGALFQSAMDPKQRRNLGAHYTSEQNILKLIKPLFLDELWEEFEKVKSSAPKLAQFHKKLSELRFLDPACGCGNFLVITYRELRELEIEVIKAQLKGQQVVDVDKLVLLNVDGFYGIEIEEFPAQIAQVALWLVDHQMNQRISAAFGEYMVRIPLAASATIACDNALRRDWQGLLPESKRYDYILGNPPFIGSKLMTEEMRTDILNVFPDVKGAGTLDFVCGWYGLAARYMIAHGGKHTRSAFVSTNSITQGEQVGALWGPLLAKGIKIHFAHQTFRWNNEARGVAAVHCIIVGFADFDVSKKRLFTYADERSVPIEEVVGNINPYLFAGPSIIAEGRMTSISGAPSIVNGSIPADGGNLILEEVEARELLQKEPGAAKWLRPYVGAEGFISNQYRQCLWLEQCTPSELKAMPHVLERVQRVREMRLASAKAPTREKANTPTLFTENRQPKAGTYLAIPRTSSENRRYIPMGVLNANFIAANDLQMVPNSTLYQFGVLSSALHNVWIHVTSGRMKSDIRYSAKYTYNTFPWPEQPTPAQKQAVEEAAQGVLDVRARYGPSLTLPEGEGSGPTPSLPEGEGVMRASNDGGDGREVHGLMTADPMLYAKLSEHAKSMRTAPTPAESALWQALRGDAAGTHFRRQHVLGRFIVDFVSLDKRLVVEVDGDIHDHQQQEDAERTAWLNSVGFEVLRFRNEEVLVARDQVVARIRSVAEARTSLRSASDPPRRGGQGGAASLADLYDPLTMPPDLVKAHQTLDKAVDKCYRPQPFTTDAKRVEYLFELYEGYTKGLLAGEKPKKGKKA